MTADDVTAASLDYLQRVGFTPPQSVPSDRLTRAPGELRTVLRAISVGRLDKGSPLAVRSGPGIPITRDLLVTLYNYMVPVAFIVSAQPGHAAVHFGTWLPEAGSAQSADYNGRLLATALRTLYPAIELEADEPAIDTWPTGGLVMGIPTPKSPDAADGAAQLDRLFRALHELSWAALVLAQPVGESFVRDLKLRVINEMRSVETARALGGVPSPLADHYMELLDGQLRAFSDGQSSGAWRTAVYLLGDDESYEQLASLWRGVFSGERSVPEAVRVWDRQDVPELASSWAMIDPAPDNEAPGYYRQPFQHQTLLTSTQLAAYVHLPNLESNGFSIRLAPAFDIVPGQIATQESVILGQVLQQGAATATPYGVSTKSLTRHAFVAGVTGSGKTNTILHLLTQIHRRGVPFLVIEPSKTEYRVLLDHPELTEHLRIFTPGKEGVAPLRLNPLEVPPGTSVSEHLDLLRAVFGASFAMWGPLPQVLERCLQEVYVDRGWDLSTNHNRRLGEGDVSWRAFPTLGDVSAKVREVVPSLGYEQRTTDDIQAALTTRFDSLRSGGKGAALNAAVSIPIEELLDAPAVIELEGMGDDDDKAFLIGLLLIRLAEHRRAAGQAEDLTHLLVIEEAHRLISNVSHGRSEYVADPRGQAVETFTNLLSEIRAYGQGVLIADQVPVRLAPDVVKNTNLKIAHRVVAADDRAVLSGAMSMSDSQQRFISTLGIGQAAVFSEGDDAPLLVSIPRVKNGSGPPNDSRVSQAMTRWRSASGLEALYLSRPFCAQTCADAPWACKLARTLMEDPFVQRTVARVVLSTAEHIQALDRMWPELVSVLRARRPASVDERTLLIAFAGHAADWYAQRRGGQAMWSYPATNVLATVLRDMLLQKATDNAESTAVRANFQDQMRELHRRDFEPYPDCGRICSHAPLCLYRAAAGDLTRSQRYALHWSRAEEADTRDDGGQRRTYTWQAAWSSAYELVELPRSDMQPAERESVTAAAQRAALCFAQQMLANDDRKVPSTARWILDRVLTETKPPAGQPSGEGNGRATS
ncbi:ATP-binding protein [Streptomyces chartreusis]|uniref:ATP-binding protein n=1 Tax=Streptomyces chartreusis TaxID=1969 RepID=UPI0036F6C907